MEKASWVDGGGPLFRAAGSPQHPGKVEARKSTPQLSPLLFPWQTQGEAHGPQGTLSTQPQSRQRVTQKHSAPGRGSCREVSCRRSPEWRQILLQKGGAGAGAGGGQVLMVGLGFVF